MLSLTMHLSSQDSFDRELTPLAIADYVVHGNQKCMMITLKGVISEDSANMLFHFFEDALLLPANRWLLQLNDLRNLSSSGLRNLARFVRILHRRGMTVKVIGIHPNVYHLLLNNREKPLGQNSNPRHALSEEGEGTSVVYS